MRGYYACISYMDAQLGRVLDELKATGADRNTMVVLWGDHGWHVREKGLWDSARGPVIIADPRGIHRPGPPLGGGRGVRDERWR